MLKRLRSLKNFFVELDRKLDRLQDDVDRKLDRLQGDMDHKLDRLQGDMDRKLDRLQVDANRKLDWLQRDVEVVKHQVSVYLGDDVKLALEHSLGRLQNDLEFVRNRVTTELRDEIARTLALRLDWLQSDLEFVRNRVTTELGEEIAQALARRLDRLQGDLEFVRTRVEVRLGDEAARALERQLDRLQNDVEFMKNRISTYLGDGVGLTYLIDETPIYINANDMGCPANFVNGGKYEEDYIAVLASFRRPDSFFLDVGANLGVFTLRLAPMLRSGRIFAFEPQPLVRELLARSVHLNGLGPLVEISGFGASDGDRLVRLAVPRGHVGGAAVGVAPEGFDSIEIGVRRLDALLGPSFSCDLVKLDVEGHEPAALRGMADILRRSETAVVLFEKLKPNAGSEEELWSCFGDIGMSVYRVEGCRLRPVTLDEFRAASAYFLAAREATVGAEHFRDFFELYPMDLSAVSGTVTDGALRTAAGARPGALLLHGPYWYLKRGFYRIELDADVEGEIACGIAEKFGYPVHEFVASATQTMFQMVIARDLNQFEFVGCAVDGHSRIDLRKVRFTRLG